MSSVYTVSTKTQWHLQAQYFFSMTSPPNAPLEVIMAPLSGMLDQTCIIIGALNTSFQ